MPEKMPRHSEGLHVVEPDYQGSLAEFKESMAVPSAPSDADTTTNTANNTTFIKEDYYNLSGRPGGSRFVKTVPVYPQPQFIKNMPPQLAAYTDYERKEEDRFEPVTNLPQNTEGTKVNTRGKIAGGVYINNISAAQEFLNTKSVFVNPKFKDPYDKIGNDPDSRDRSRGPLIVPRERQDTLRAMSLGVNQWAEATSKYFNKPVVVGKSPVRNYKSAPLTSEVIIGGAEAGNAYAGSVGLWGSAYTSRPKKVLKAPGGENRVTQADQVRQAMTLNTDISLERYGMGPKQWAQTTQHEFGHTMGIGHPHEKAGGTTLNSEMSYDAPREGATILPATLNAYRNLMNMNLGFTGVKKLIDEDRKMRINAQKLKKLNEKYNKKYGGR